MTGRSIWEQGRIPLAGVMLGSCQRHRVILGDTAPKVFIMMWPCNRWRSTLHRLYMQSRLTFFAHEPPNVFLSLRTFVSNTWRQNWCVSYLRSMLELYLVIWESKKVSTSQENPSVSNSFIKCHKQSCVEDPKGSVPMNVRRTLGSSQNNDIILESRKEKGITKRMSYH